MFATIWKTAVALITCLALIDVIGVVACTWFDISPFSSNSVALPYTIWFVGGVFAGAFTIAWAGSWVAGGEGWTDREDARAIALRVLAVSALISLALSLFFWRIYWSKWVAGEYYVPDSMPHSLTYVLSTLATLAFAAWGMGKKPAAGAA